MENENIFEVQDELLELSEEALDELSNNKGDED